MLYCSFFNFNAYIYIVNCCHSLELFFYFIAIGQVMAGLTTTDKALTFSYLMYLNDLRGSGKLSEDNAEGLEGLYVVHNL